MCSSDLELALDHRRRVTGKISVFFPLFRGSRRPPATHRACERDHHSQPPLCATYPHLSAHSAPQKATGPAMLGAWVKYGSTRAQKPFVHKERKKYPHAKPSKFRRMRPSGHHGAVPGESAEHSPWSPSTICPWLPRSKRGFEPEMENDPRWTNP